MSEKKESSVITKKTFSISVNYYDDGTMAMHRVNEGFGAMELLGTLSFITQEVVKQMAGDIKPTVITREVHKPDN